MFPELRLVHGATQVVVSCHALAIVVGVAAGTIVAVRRAPAPAPVLAAVAAVVVAALAGAHALFRMLHGGPGRLWSGGLASSGGVAAGLVAAVVVARLARRPAAGILDAIAPAGLVALGIGRIGCFLAGCCYGRPTGLPWGVLLPALGAPPRHPLQLYSAAADLGLVVLLLRPRPDRPGVVFRRACIGFGCLRAGLEMLRDGGATDLLPGGAVTLAQAAALMLATTALVAGRACAAGGLRLWLSPRRRPLDGR